MATERPWMKFYGQDHLGDPALSMLCRDSKHAWLELVILIDGQGRDGVLAISRQQLATYWRVSEAAMDKYLEEFESSGVGDFKSNDGGVEITCRRVRRDARNRAALKVRQDRFKEKSSLSRVDNAPATEKQRADNDEITLYAHTRPDARGQRPELKSKETKDQTTEEPPCRAEPRRQADSGPLLDVLAHYRTYHPRAIPKPSAKSKEVKLIKARLAEGFSVLDLRAAIDGCHRDPYHCGSNEQGKKYQSLALIFRDGSKVSDLMEAASPTNNGHVLSKHTQTTVETIKRELGL